MVNGILIREAQYWVKWKSGKQKQKKKRNKQQQQFPKHEQKSTEQNKFNVSCK